MTCSLTSRTTEVLYSPYEWPLAETGTPRDPGCAAKGTRKFSSMSDNHRSFPPLETRALHAAARAERPFPSPRTPTSVICSCVGDLAHEPVAWCCIGRTSQGSRPVVRADDES